MNINKIGNHINFPFDSKDILGIMPQTFGNTRDDIRIVDAECNSRLIKWMTSNQCDVRPMKCCDYWNVDLQEAYFSYIEASQKREMED